MSIQQQVEEILAQAEASELLDRLKSQLDQVTPPTEDDEPVLTQLFQTILSNVDPTTAMWDAFLLGQTWERAMEEI